MWCAVAVACGVTACSSAGPARSTPTTLPSTAHDRLACSALAVVFTAAGQAPTAAEGQALLAAAGQADNAHLKAEATALLAASQKNDTPGVEHALAAMASTCYDLGHAPPLPKG
jgi:hypothetical protein